MDTIFSSLPPLVPSWIEFLVAVGITLAAGVQFGYIVQRITGEPCFAAFAGFTGNLVGFLVFSLPFYFLVFAALSALAYMQPMGGHKST